MFIPNAHEDQTDFYISQKYFQTVNLTQKYLMSVQCNNPIE